MKYSIDSETLQFLWSTLNEKPERPKLFQAERIFQRLAIRGWVFPSDIEDILDLLDSRLGTYQFNVVDVANALGFRWETTYYRPKANSINVTGFDAIRVEDAAFFLFMLEGLGFQVDATNLVKLLLPAIKSKKKQLFSSSELEIFWFEKTRHKHAGITLSLASNSAGDEILKTIKTESGYTVDLRVDEDGKASQLNVSSPKFRNIKKPVRTFCKECGLEWYRGDPDSSQNHRQEHKVRMKYLDPKPSAEFIEGCKTNSNPELVTYISPQWMQEEMYIRAKAFKRELGYDFIQWHSPNGVSDPNAQGILFTDTSSIIVGACSFYDRTGEDNIKLWGLQWVWICPKERRKGHLATHWKSLRERFGDFKVEPPVSDLMVAFLTKHGDTALLNYP